MAKTPPIIKAKAEDISAVMGQMLESWMSRDHAGHKPRIRRHVHDAADVNSARYFCLDDGEQLEIVHIAEVRAGVTVWKVEGKVTRRDVPPETLVLEG